MTKWIIYVCLCALLFCSEPFGMKAFDSLTQNNILRQRFIDLIESDLGKSVGQPVTPPDSADRYTLAIYVTRCVRKLRTSKFNLIDDSKSISTLIYLVRELKSEIDMLNMDATEFELEIESHLDKPKIIKTEESLHKGLSIDSMEINAQNNSSKNGDFQSLVDLTVVGLNQIEGYLRLGVNQRSNPNHHQKKNPRLLVDEAKLSYTGNKHFDEIRMGKYTPDIGMGLSNSSNIEGMEILGKYQNYEFQLGYFDGLFAAVTSPMLMNLPVTFYTMQERSLSQLENFNQHFQSNRYHSGLYFEHLASTYKLRTEFAEFSQSGIKYGRVDDQRSFSLSLDIFATKKLQIGGAMTHTGEKFEARNGQNSLRNKSNFDAKDKVLQEEVLKSLSRYFGKDIYSVPGTSDIKFKVNYQATNKSSVELHFNRLYDHTRYEINKNNAFNLGTINYLQKLDENSEFLISLQSLNWDRLGSASEGFMAGHRRENMQSLQSAYRLRF